jgi:hypothetical protein
VNMFTTLQEYHKTRGMCCDPPRGASTRTIAEGFQLNGFRVVNVSAAGAALAPAVAAGGYQQIAE